MFNIESILNLKQWVCYKKEYRNNKVTKIPINANNGRYAKINNTSDFVEYDKAIESCKKYKLDGVGFVLINGYFGIDLDNVIEDGKIKEYAIDIIKIADSYTEVSPSGKGIHIICKGEKPKGKSRNDYLEMYQSQVDKDGKVTNARYLTFTKEIIENKNKINERSKEALVIYNKYLKVGVCNMDNILEKMFNSRNGSTIRALWNGDETIYGNDNSRSVMALINHLAYWCNYDKYLIDDLFRQSTLFANMKCENGIKKWDKIHDGSRTYGQMTIDKACENKVPYSRVNENLNNYKTNIEEDADYSMHDLFINTLFKDINKNALKFSEYKTGFKNIDDNLTLYSGLYLLGAQSSLGKTTFLHQIADNFAKDNKKVLYFSFEQKADTFACKSLTRLSFYKGKRKKVKDVRIDNEENNELIREYTPTASNLKIIECCEVKYDLNKIDNYIKGFINKYKEIPIVFIDYLQLIRDYEKNHQASIDENMAKLREIQRKYNMIMFVISSLNRNSYYNIITKESFNGSGNIEYSADVMLGMQYKIMNDNSIFDDDKHINKKKKMLEEEQLKKVRDIEVVILKNRDGATCKSLFFKYYTEYNVFEEYCENDKNNSCEDLFVY